MSEPTAESIAIANECADIACDYIYTTVYQERLAQNSKWGLQRHPTLDKVISFVNGQTYRHAQEFEIPTADRAKFLCNHAEQEGTLTWTNIAVEELAEAVEAAVLHGEHSTELHTELVQLAAVVFAWIESVDAGSES